jgi:hypothetical protein
MTGTGPATETLTPGRITLLSWVLCLSWLPLLACSCGALRSVPRPQHGGGSTVTLPAVAAHTNSVRLTLAAPENPAGASRQTYDRVTTYGTVTPPQVVTEPLIIRTGSALIFTNRTTLIPGSTNTTVTEEHQATELGVTQPDHARAAWGAVALVGAKLESMRPVQFAGILMVLFGLATFTPWLAAVVPSITSRLIILGAGLALIILPVVIVGHEVLILAGATGVAGLWVFAHRHGELKGKAEVAGALIASTPTDPRP